jgi:hypothetical protein
VTVYVDTARIPATVAGRAGRWSHLTADSRDELHRLADRIGLRRSWFQDPTRPHGQPGAHWHFDVTDPKRAAAIAAGAQVISRRELGQLLTARRATASGEARPPRPRRIQLRRGKGWRLGEHCVVVARPTRWGNPFALCAGVPGQPGHAGIGDRFTAVAVYAAHLSTLLSACANGRTNAQPPHGSRWSAL